jgi:hypothetical protein
MDLLRRTNTQAWEPMGIGGSEMGGIVRSGVAAHDAACLLAEAVRQAAVAGSSSQAVIDAAELVYFRTVLASAKANGCGIEPALTGLRDLGFNS